MPSRSTLTSILRWLVTLLAIAILIWLLAREGWGEIVANLRAIAPWRMAVAAGLIIVSRFAVSARWYVLLRSGGIRTTFGQALRITFAGLFASNFLPTTVGGDVVRLGSGVRLGFDSAITLSSLVVDRLVGMAAYGMAVPFGLSAFAAHLPEIVHSLQASLPRRPVSTWAYAPATLLAFAGIGQKLAGVQAALRKLAHSLTLWLKHPGALLLALGFSWLRMACDFLIVWVLLAGMGEPMSFWLIAGLSSIAYFITLIPISINGIGWQDLSVTVLYTLVGGVSAASAGVLALFLRLLPMLASLPGALFMPEMIAGTQKETK